MLKIKLPDTITIGESLYEFFDQLIKYYGNQNKQTQSAESKRLLMEIFYLRLNFAISFKGAEEELKTTFSDAEDHSPATQELKEKLTKLKKDFKGEAEGIRKAFDILLMHFAGTDYERYLSLIADKAVLLDLQQEENFQWFKEKVDTALKSLATKNEKPHAYMRRVAAGLMNECVGEVKVVILQYADELLTKAHEFYWQTNDYETICRDQLVFLGCLFCIPKKKQNNAIADIYQTAEQNLKKTLSFCKGQKHSDIIVNTLIKFLTEKDPVWCGVEGQIVLDYRRSITSILSLVISINVLKGINREDLLNLYCAIAEFYKNYHEADLSYQWAKKALLLMANAAEYQKEQYQQLSVIIKILAETYYKSGDLETGKVLVLIAGLFVFEESIIPYYPPRELTRGDAISIEHVLKINLTRKHVVLNLQELYKLALKIKGLSGKKMSIPMFGGSTPGIDKCKEIRDKASYYTHKYLKLADRFIKLVHETQSKTTNLELMKILAAVNHLIILVADHLPKIGEINKWELMPKEILQKQLVSLQQKIHELQNDFENDSSEAKVFNDSLTGEKRKQTSMTDYVGSVFKKIKTEKSEDDYKETGNQSFDKELLGITLNK